MPVSMVRHVKRGTNSMETAPNSRGGTKCIIRLGIIIRMAIGLTVALAWIAIPAPAQEDPDSPQDRTEPALSLKLEPAGEVMAGFQETAGGQASQALSKSTQKTALKSPSTAGLISLGFTAAPIAISAFGHFQSHEGTAVRASLLAGGLILGPAAGYIYGGAGGEHAILGVLLRTGTGLLTLFGGLGALSQIGFWATCGLAILDIMLVSSYVQKHNLEIQKKSLTVAPIVFPDKKGVGAGIQFSFSF